MFNEFDAALHEQMGRDLIVQLTTEIETALKAKAQEGIEIESMMVYEPKEGEPTPSSKVIEAKIIEIARKRGISEDVIGQLFFKKEGMAFVATDERWLEVDAAGKSHPNNDGRVFIPDLPIDKILNHKEGVVEPRIKRWELLIGFKEESDKPHGFKPIDATDLRTVMQDVMKQAMTDLYPGAIVTTRPKLVSNISGIIREDATIHYMKNTAWPTDPKRTIIPADSPAQTLADVYRLHGVKVSPEIPGLGMQPNYSFFDKEGKNILNGKDDEFSDLAWQMAAGMVYVQLHSAAGFLSTIESFDRTGRKGRDFAQIANDAIHCKPGFIGLMHTDACKFDPHTQIMLRPYSGAAGDRIKGMTLDPTRAKEKGAAYGAGATDQRGGIWDRIESRMGDCVSNQVLQSVMELMAMKVGIEKFGHMSREQIQSWFAQPQMSRQLGDSLHEEVGRLRTSAIHHEYLPEKYMELTLEYLHKQKNYQAELEYKKAGDSGIREYCGAPQLHALAA